MIGEFHRGNEVEPDIYINCITTYLDIKLTKCFPGLDELSNYFYLQSVKIISEGVFKNSIQDETAFSKL